MRSIATGAFTKDSTPNLRHLILPMSVDGVGREAIIDCEEFEELTYYNDRIYVCDDAFNARRLKLMQSYEYRYDVGGRYNVIEVHNISGGRVCSMPLLSYGVESND